MIIKKSLTAAMKKDHLSVAAVAKLLGVTNQAVYKYMLQDVRMSTVTKLAELFDMKASQFISLGEEQNE